MANNAKPRKKYNPKRILSANTFNSQDLARVMLQPLQALASIKQRHILGKFEGECYVQLQAMIMHASKIAQYRNMAFDCQKGIRVINKIEHKMQVNDVDIQRLEDCAKDCRRVLLGSTLAQNEQADIDLRIYIEAHGGRYVGWGVK